MDLMLIAVIAGACGLVCAGLMTCYVLRQPQSYESFSEGKEYLMSFQGDPEPVYDLSELAQIENDEALTVAK